ncbi:MAG: hypothetical protein L6308_02965 [Candidatus Omnitrophica bacterium]|nr:hypothetical protein [Candidatus Omnitrophota bacterium]
MATDIITTVSAATTPYVLTGNTQSIIDLGEDGAKVLTIKIFDAAGNEGAASLAVNIVKDFQVGYFKVTGTTSTMVTGDSQVITISAYNINNAIVTSYTGEKSLIFSGLAAAPGGTAPTLDGIAVGASNTVTFVDGVATKTLVVYNAATTPINVTDGLTKSSIGSSAYALALTVKHNDVNHLNFSGDLPASGIKAGAEFSFGRTLNAVDFYDNICTGANLATAFTGTKNIIWTIGAGKVQNGPEANLNDYFVSSAYVYANPSPVIFSAGVSTTPLVAKLYYAQATTITATIPITDSPSLVGTSSSITVAPDDAVKTKFIQQPAPIAPLVDFITTPQTLASQPISITDQYGNIVTTFVGSVSLLPFTDTTVPTAATHTLGATGGLTKTAVNGTATFEGITYNYPENIYLRASSSVESLTKGFSSVIAFATEHDASASAGALTEPTSISSLANSTTTAVLDFIITDAMTDGFATNITSISVRRDIYDASTNLNGDTTGGWGGYIKEAYMYIDNVESTKLIGSIENNQIVFSTACSVPNNNIGKTFALKIVLQNTLPLPAAVDGKRFAFIIDPESDITLNPIGSKFTTTDSYTSAPYIQVTATDFKITGTAAMNAGNTQPIVITAIDALGNTDKDFTGGEAKILTFSGANTGSKVFDAPVTTIYPTTTISPATAVAFATSTGVVFTNGISVPVTITLYKKETANIKASHTTPTVTTSNKNALTVAVAGGDAAGLLWSVQPVAVAVENAPWKDFTLMVSDLYGNPSSKDMVVGITPSDGVVSSGADILDHVTSVDGYATFYDFAVSGIDEGRRITVSADATGIIGSVASDQVTSYKEYTVTFNVRDYTGGSNLTECTLNASRNSADVATFPKVSNSPFTFKIPYGTYTFKTTKDKYVDDYSSKIAGVGADYLDGKYDAKIAWSITLTSLSEVTADYDVSGAFIYDETTDRLSIRAWLEKRGKIVLDDTVNKLGIATVEVYNDTNDSWFAPIEILTDSGGVFVKVATKVIVGGGEILLVAGRSYYARIVINYGGSAGDGNAYEGGTTFSITVNEAIRQATTAIQGVTGQIMAQTIEIKAVVKDEIKGQVDKIIVPEIQKVKIETDKILTATGSGAQSIQTKIDEVKLSVAEDIKPHITSGILNSETSIKQGGKMTIRYRATTGLKPVLSVYNPKDVQLVASKSMAEIGATGIYQYDVTFSWGTGAFTIICSEPTKGTVDALVISVTQYDIESVSGNVSAVLGATTGLGGVKDIVATVGAQFNNMDMLLSKISRDIAGKIGDTKSAVNDLSAAFKQLEEMSKQIKEIGGTTGINLQKLYDVSKDKKDDINYIKNKSEELKAAMELNQKMLENVAKKPIVQTWFEFK